MTRGSHGDGDPRDGDWILAAHDAPPDTRDVRAPVAASILRFITHLGRDSESDLMHALADAAAIWFDVDVRVYHRTISGAMVLHTALQPSQIDNRQRHIPRDRLHALAIGIPRRVRVARWTWDSGQMHVVALGQEDTPAWLLMFHGPRSGDAANVVAILTPTLTSTLKELGRTRVESFRAHVSNQVSGESSIAESARIVARETAAAIGAAAVRVVLRRGSTQHTLASWPGPVTGHRATPRGDRTMPRRIVRLAAIDPATAVALDVRSGAEEFDASAAGCIAAAAAIMRETLARLAPRAGVPADGVMKVFEQRLREEIVRAKRYDLGLSLVVVRAKQARPQGAEIRSVTGMLKQGLRACDLVGRVAPGAVGVLLVNTHAPVVGAVVTRLEQRIAQRAPRHGEGWTLGVASLAADCASPGALIAKALRQGRPVLPER